ncbi:unnamed protein product [Withania somnifera]
MLTEISNIDQPCIQGEMTQDTSRINCEVVDHYKKLYIKTSQWRSTCPFPNSPVLTKEKKESIQRGFEEEEVLGCLKLCTVDKAPGPYGFTMVSLIPRR